MLSVGDGTTLRFREAATAAQRPLFCCLSLHDKSGIILVLIFPPMGICIGLMVMSYKKRNQFGEQSNSEPKSDRSSDLGW
jgi:hypothetical protein